MSVLFAVIAFGLLAGFFAAIDQIVRARRAKRFPKQLEEWRKQFGEVDKDSEKK